MIIILGSIFKTIIRQYTIRLKQLSDLLKKNNTSYMKILVYLCTILKVMGFARAVMIVEHLEDCGAISTVDEAKEMGLEKSEQIVLVRI